jgi:hypothetical protein
MEKVSSIECREPYIHWKVALEFWQADSTYKKSGASDVGNIVKISRITCALCSWLGRVSLNTHYYEVLLAKKRLTPWF